MDGSPEKSLASDVTDYIFLLRDFLGFGKLFDKFINETGPSVLWDRIETLPPDAVSRL